MKTKLLLLLSVLFYVGCSDDDVIDKVPLSKQIVGSWYAEYLSSSGKLVYEESVFSEGGIYNVILRLPDRGYATEYAKGQYSFDDNANTVHYNFSLNEQNQVVDGNIEINDFEMTGISYIGAHTYWRIIGTQNMTLKEAIDLNVSNWLSVYLSEIPSVLTYDIVDESIADIDNKGKIIPKLSGTTYIKIHTTSGIVVVKLNISDKDNLWNDYSFVFGESLDETQSLLGPFYQGKIANNDISYLLDNYYADYVSIKAVNNHVIEYTIKVKESVDQNVILDYLNRKYTIFQSNNYLSQFANLDNDKYSSIQIDYYNNYISYYNFYEGWDDYSYVFDLSTEELTDLFGDSDFDDDSSIMYFVNTYSVHSITFYFQRETELVYEYEIGLNFDISKDYILDYLNRNYHKTKDDQFEKQIQMNGNDYTLSVTVGFLNTLHYSIRK